MRVRGVHVHVSLAVISLSSPALPSISYPYKNNCCRDAYNEIPGTPQQIQIIILNVLIACRTDTIYTPMYSHNPKCFYHVHPQPPPKPPIYHCDVCNGCDEITLEVTYSQGRVILGPIGTCRRWWNSERRGWCWQAPWGASACKHPPHYDI